MASMARFFSLINDSCLSGKGEAWVDGDPIDFVRQAYDRPSKLRGYRLLKPLLLFPNLDALESYPCRFVEYSAAADGLQGAYQAAPVRFSYSIDRFGTDYQIRILK